MSAHRFMLQLDTLLIYCCDICRRCEVMRRSELMLMMLFPW